MLRSPWGCVPDGNGDQATIAICQTRGLSADRHTLPECDDSSVMRRGSPSQDLRTQSQSEDVQLEGAELDSWDATGCN
jgi:hypothetical protein